MTTPIGFPAALHSPGGTVDPNLDVQAVVDDWFAKFANAIGLKDVTAIVDLFIDSGFWRDMLALTWGFRTFEGMGAVSKFLMDQLPVFDPQPDTFSLQRNSIELQRLYENVTWIQAIFKFDTRVGHASGVLRLVPLSSSTWKAHVVYTNLEALKGFPEHIGPLRSHDPNHGKWAEKRAREREFLDEEPTVIIVGGGQSGLEVAARLKMLEVSVLVVERNPRIGDNWRNRYDTLCLQDAVWYDHLAYLPFPPSWPVYIPALKFADWLEFYADSLELNVWTSTTVVSIEKETGESGKRWSILVERADGSARTFKLDHVVLALGIGSGLPRTPNIPGQEEFKGEVLHSTQYKNATHHMGKKVVVVGSGTSAHDICADYVDHGVDITMVQRGPTYVMSVKEGMPRLLELYWESGLPTEVADRVTASYPAPVLKVLQQRVTKTIAEADRDLLNGLRKVGFKHTLGIDDTGSFPLALNRAGGFYLDVGASQLIIDRKIKLKNDRLITRFTPTGLLFEDGSTLDADVVLFATGYGDARSGYANLIKNTDLHAKIREIWGTNQEGEINGVFLEIGVPGEEGKALSGIWSIIGNLAMCRFHSRHIALQIKAYQEGLFGVRYEDTTRGT